MWSEKNLTFTTGGKVKGNRQFGRQSDVFFKNSEYIYIFPNQKFLGIIYPKEWKTVSTNKAPKTYTWMFLAVLFKIATTWNQLWYSSGSEWINWDIFRQWNIIQWLKEVSDQAIKRLRENLNAYYCLRKANLKRLHTVWSQLYHCLEKA